MNFLQRPSHAGPRRTHALLLAFALAVFVWSGIFPRDRFTWVLEVLPAIVGGIVLLATYRHFRFTTLVYLLISLHMAILFIGGHYTYAEVPLFNQLKEVFHLSRNHFDRVGHFAQGFVPAIIGRELLLRRSPLQRGKWLSTIIISFSMAISALYEIFEWLVAAATGSAADAFLGTQGDLFDTQKDMLMALIGATTAVLLMSRLHDRALNHLSDRNSGSDATIR